MDEASYFGPEFAGFLVINIWETSVTKRGVFPSEFLKTVYHDLRPISTLTLLIFCGALPN